MIQSEGQQAGRMNPLEYARQWSKLPTEHFKATIAALEKDMEREHAERMLELQQRDLADKRRFRLEMTGLMIGGVLAAGSLALTVSLAQSQPLIAAMTGLGSSVSLVTVIAMFVLKRSPNAADLKLLGRPSMVPQPAAPADPATIPQP
ncbi:hypothetical protein [Kitasatospora indigofera]|uniref:hypothetical protein n=1 Tax=Kitasatospora indigofera TaxID=67307 RepID=UPI0033BE2404